MLLVATLKMPLTKCGEWLQVVNFTNIFRAHLRHCTCAKKSSNLYCKYKKSSHETVAQKSHM